MLGFLVPYSIIDFIPFLNVEELQTGEVNRQMQNQLSIKAKK
jgi:hypothetical protein